MNKASAAALRAHGTATLMAMMAATGVNPEDVLRAYHTGPNASILWRSARHGGIQGPKARGRHCTSLRKRKP